ncbi:hypothetical protein [Poriferisphaera sp. WC338]|uniref:hypothetical protein n=1 Tax=Poriferisphaera sp. WC338 TaxID=3425129 RepID=UPI003D818F17
MLFQFAGAAHFVHLVQKHVTPKATTPLVVVDHSHNLDHTTHHNAEICSDLSGTNEQLFKTCVLCLTITSVNKNLLLTKSSQLAHSNHMTRAFMPPSTIAPRSNRNANLARGPPLFS